MGASVNKVTLLGRLGKDPEIRYTGDGKAVANFSVATDETYKDRSGEKQKKTEWHNIVVWGDTATNFVQPYLKKGDLVYIEGKLQTRTWDDKEGNKKYSTEVVVLDIKGVQTSGGQDAQQAQPQSRPQSNSRPQGNTRGAAPAARQSGYRRPPQQQADPQAFPTQEADDSDIPF